MIDKLITNLLDPEINGMLFEMIRDDATIYDLEEAFKQARANE